MRRASGVVCERLTGDLFIVIPPTITNPVIITPPGSPLEELTNCASPIVPPAPPLFSNCTFFTTPAACIALANSRPVPSQPPPGFAGIIILMESTARAGPLRRSATAIAAAREQIVAFMDDSPLWGKSCADATSRNLSNCLRNLGFFCRSRPQVLADEPEDPVERVARLLRVRVGEVVPPDGVFVDLGLVHLAPGLQRVDEPAAVQLPGSDLVP